ncbi:unnamed protein product [Ectocarpus sp. 12 AP-2014]
MLLLALHALASPTKKRTLETLHILYHAQATQRFWCGVRSPIATKTNKLADTSSTKIASSQNRPSLALFPPLSPYNQAHATAEKSDKFGNWDEGGEESLECCSNFVNETSEFVTWSSERSVSTAGQSIDGVNFDQQENCGHLNVFSVHWKYELKAGLRSLQGGWRRRSSQASTFGKLGETTQREGEFKNDLFCSRP